MNDLGPVLIGVVVLLGIGFLVLLFAIGIYNGLVARRNRFKNSYGQIDVQLKRRYDLIPNLVEAVKGYMTHEKGTLEAVISARNQAANAGVKAAANPGDPEAMKTLMVAESSLGGTLGRLFALSEAYPDLKANQNMMQLQEELTLAQIPNTFYNIHLSNNIFYISENDTTINQFAIQEGQYTNESLIDALNGKYGDIFFNLICHWTLLQ